MKIKCGHHCVVKMIKVRLDNAEKPGESRPQVFDGCQWWWREGDVACLDSMMSGSQLRGWSGTCEFVSSVTVYDFDCDCMMIHSPSPAIERKHSHSMIQCLCVCFLPSVLWHCWLGDRKRIRPLKDMGAWWRWALLSPDGVVPIQMVGVPASVNLPLHHKVQKFFSGTGSPGWSRKKGRKTVVVVWWTDGRRLKLWSLLRCHINTASLYSQQHSGKHMGYQRGEIHRKS